MFGSDNLEITKKFKVIAFILENLRIFKNG
jgi:hypothetical protein